MPDKYKIYQVLPEMYPRLVQTIGNILYDGDGNILNIKGSQGVQGRY